MKKSILFISLILSSLVVNGKDLYIKTFGSNKNKPIIFLHGGPGYNCVNFEQTTAQKLAEKDFFVIVYDRRGEGRSNDSNAKFNFEEAIRDLNNIYRNYGLQKAILLGHSFGGIVATLFAESHHEKIEKLILLSTPVSLQATFKNIISRSKSIYESKNDTENLNYILMLEKADSTSIEYSSYCFRHAMNNSFYQPKNITLEAKKIYSKFKTDSLLIKHASKMTFEATQGYWENEKYTTIDLTSKIVELQKKNIKVFGIYGKDDGLFSLKQIADLRLLIGFENVLFLDDCSHNVFIDQQTLFFEYLINFK